MDTMIEYTMIGDAVITYKSVVVHKFSIYEDDPDLFAGQHLYNWEMSEPGKFIQSHASDVTWKRNSNYIGMSHEFAIVAKIEEKYLTEYYLKWGQNGNSKS